MRYPSARADITPRTIYTHMKKTLITLAALAMASVAQAATPTDGKLTVTGDITDGVWLPNGDTTIEANGDYTVNAIKGYSINSTTANYTKTGTGTLTVNGDSEGYAGKQPVTDVTVAAGTLKINYKGAIGKGSVTVEDGATLELAQATTYGNSNGDNPLALELNGGTISGDGSLALEGGVISATGADNVVSVDLKQAWNVNIAVAENGDLTFSGALVPTSGAAYFVKQGAGELIIDSSELNKAFTLQLEAGTVDLTAVSSLGAINAANNTTIKFGGESLNFNGALTLGSGVTFDMTEWTGTLGDAFSGVTALNAASPVTVLLADGTTKEMTLSLHNGSVSIPEPTTATLSLLALAGLAARRRRK